MDTRTRRSWIELADTIHALNHVDRTGRHEEPEIDGPAGRLREAVEALVAAAGGVWDPGVQAAVMALPQASGIDRASPTAAPLGAACTSYARALRHALLVVTGRSADVHPCERARLRRMVGASPTHAHLAASIPEGRAASAGGASSTSGAVGFAFAWKPRRGKGPWVLDAATTAIRHVTAAEAPVVARLKPDDGDWFALREIDGVLHRPVFSPGAWEAATVQTFADACAGGVAWVDSPFAPPPPWDATVAALSDVAVVGAPARDAGERDAALRECLARAGALVAVDGVVHRPCAEPTLHLAMRRLPRTGRDNVPDAIRPAWSMGGIDAFTVQSPDRCFPPVKVCDALAGLDRGDAPDVDGGRRAARHVRTTDLGLRLGDGRALAALADAAAEALADSAFWCLPKPYVAEVPTIADVDVGRFPEDPDAIPRALVRHAKAAGAPWDRVPGISGMAGDVTAGALRVEAEAGRSGAIRPVKPRPGYLVYLDPTGHDELGLAGIKALARAAAATLERNAAAEPDGMAEFSP